MQIECPVCGECCECEISPVIGQHLLCPYCESKFSYKGESESSSPDSQQNSCSISDARSESMQRKITSFLEECAKFFVRKWKLLIKYCNLSPKLAVSQGKCQERRAGLIKLIDYAVFRGYMPNVLMVGSILLAVMFKNPFVAIVSVGLCYLGIILWRRNTLATQTGKAVAIGDTLKRIGIKGNVLAAIAAVAISSFFTLLFNQKPAKLEFVESKVSNAQHVALEEEDIYKLIRYAEDMERGFSEKHARLTVADFVIYHDLCLPTAGEFYEMGEVYFLRILQVFSDGILVWPTKNIVADNPRSAWTPVFIKMQSTRNLRAGENPPWGVVKATGAQASYTSKSGLHNTVDVFAMLSEADATVWKSRTEKAKEDDYRTRKENQEAFKKEFAAKLFSSLEFDISKRIMVDKAVAPYADQIKIEVKHFAWNELRKKCAAKDWLGALNVSYDILANNGTLTNRYKDYPELSEISQLFLGLKKKNFSANIELQIPNEVRCGAITINNCREWNLKYSGFDMSDRTIKKYNLSRIKIFESFTPFEALFMDWGLSHVAFADETILIGKWEALNKLATVLNINHKEGDIDYDVFYGLKQKIYFESNHDVYQGLSESHEQMRRLGEEAEEIDNAYQERKISLEDHNLRMLEINKKFNPLISSNFFSLRDPAAIEKAKRERQADLEREQQELKLKTEETERKRQAELKLKLEAERQELDKYTSEIFKKIQTLPLSFDIADHLIVQKALIPYIHSIVITERDWEELRQLHESGDYMGLLKAVAKRNNVAMDETRKGDLEKAEKMLERIPFHVQIEGIHNRGQIGGDRPHESQIFQYFPDIGPATAPILASLPSFRRAATP